MQFIRCGIDERSAYPPQNNAHFDPLGGTAGVENDHHVHVCSFYRIGQGLIDHDDQVDVALLGIEASHDQRAVQIHSDQVILQDLP